MNRFRKNILIPPHPLAALVPVDSPHADVGVQVAALLRHSAHNTERHLSGPARSALSCVRSAGERQKRGTQQNRQAGYAASHTTLLQFPVFP